MGRAPRFRPARADDSARLTELAVTSKRHWGYPDSWIELWREELRFTPELIATQSVEVAEVDGRAVGVSAVSVDGAGAELEHLWVEPAHLGKGLGRALFERCAERAAGMGARRLAIASDPNAEGFYRHMGAEPRGAVASRPEGRRLPLLVLTLGATGPDRTSRGAGKGAAPPQST